ncbi:MAG TPA: hypothetical protein VK324_00185 [Tepidisphaeraceae bacterium]|nr:hypothetical protein [Tepidisphaeraceae bacterium]
MNQASDGQRPQAVYADDLGARILAAAKLAVSMHLYQSTLGHREPSATRQQVKIGGAGPTFVTDDDMLPMTASRRAAGGR